MTGPNPLVNLCQIQTATTGTGTITLGSASPGYRGTAALTNATVYSYSILDGTNYELGQGTYTSSGTTLTRGPVQSSNSNAAISLSGSAIVIVGDALSWDIQPSGQSWTPSDQSGAGLSFSSVSANYTKIGNIVFVYAVLTYPSTVSASPAQIGGLPFTTANAPYINGITQYIFVSNQTYPAFIDPVQNATKFNLFLTGPSFLQLTNAQLSTAIVEFSFWYPVA